MHVTLMQTHIIYIIIHAHTCTCTYTRTQSKGAILDGTLPCTKEEATLLAAIQCHIQYGKHDSSKLIPIVEFLPNEYLRAPDVECAIMNEYEKLWRFTEPEAKFAYIQQCRSLPTYGLTIFHVKKKAFEKMKLIPILLGIKRDAIITLEVKTKCVADSWPLQRVHSWAQTPNTFVLVSWPIFIPHTCTHICSIYIYICIHWSSFVLF